MLSKYAGMHISAKYFLIVLYGLPTYLHIRTYSDKIIMAGLMYVYLSNYC